jgi:uncharacterized protein (TIGR04551 family)
MLSERTLATAITLLICAAPSVAGAQPQPTQPQPGQNPAQTGPTTKTDGVAQQGPKRADLLPTVPVLPPDKNERKAFELIELNGYFRFRGDWFKKFDGQFNDDPELGGGPFPNALACTLTDGVDKPCEGTLKSANIRLRLEPVININEKTRVLFQVDLLDNVVLGSTPDNFYADGTAAPGNSLNGAFTGGQLAPEAGRNELSDSVRVNQAWGEVETSFGLIKFGRMPDHWGLGVLANAGGRDPIHDNYDLDADFGDTEDRVSFSTTIPGTDFLASVAMDWSQVAPVSSQTDVGAARGRRGQPWDLDDNDDVNQYVFTIARRDTQSVFAEKVANGELAVNYGVYFVYRTQNFDQTGVTLGDEPPADQFVPRSLTLFQPDGWLRLAWGDLEVEAEAIVGLGDIEQANDLGATDGLDIRQLAFVLRGAYKLVDGDLKLGLETGFASGDQFDNDPQGSIHVSNAVLPSGADTTLNQFFFDFDYKIDLILFRELFGTVTNAFYAKPSLTYDITDQIRAGGATIVSWAHRPVATPGNSPGLGVEIDVDLGYHDDTRGFYAGFAYGVLFPMSGLDHPADDTSAGGPGFGYDTNVGEMATAQTIQLRMALKF